MLKRAMLIGINEYSDPSISNLLGCVNDVEALLPLLRRNDDDSPNFECEKLISTEREVTREKMLQAIDRLLAPGADVALLYFAGHGNAEAGDVTLVAQNGTKAELGIAFSSILGKIRNSLVGEIVIILDCCYSGNAGSVPQIGGEGSVIRKGVSILTASRGDQTAEESATSNARGIFSTYLCGALDGGAADVLGKVTLAGIYSYLSESFGAFTARPTFKANVERLHELRLNKPAVPLSELRQLTKFFLDRNSNLQLDPSFEPTADPKGHSNERIFAILQRCRAAKLVEPVGTEHMYDAAMQGMACCLTPLGKHYWNLVKKGWI